MAQATNISLKVKLDEDIRRFSVHKDITFDELQSLISKHFVLAPENVQLKYIDDEEELITLGSDLELQEAKRLQPTVLRLNVYDIKPKRDPSDQIGKLEAVFVRDVTVPDSTNVSAGVKFRKVWCVKNSGSEPWPKGVVLKMVDPKDDQLLVLAVGAINRSVAPGEETDIGVELQAPSRPGRCVQYWRLFTADGEAFGRRLWIDISITPSPQATAEKEAELLRAEEEVRRAREEEERLRQQQEAERVQQELEALERKRAEEEEAERRQLEEEELRLEEEKLRLEEEKKRLAEEEDRRRAQEAAERDRIEQLRIQQEEEERRRKEEEELRKKKEEEEALKKAAEERKKREEELKRKHEEERRMNSKYPAQLTALAEMGFTNVEHNVKLLDKHKGSLDLALEALLSGN